MAWRWRYERSDGSVVNRATAEVEVFSTQSDAESWVGESWQELLDAGIDAVTLFEDKREVYGPMSLHPPDS